MLTFSEQTDKILPAYKKALDEMGKLKKNANNPHFKSKYADLTAVMDTADDPLSKHGLFHIEGQGGRVEGGEYYAVVISRIIHAESGQWVQNEMLLPLSKADPQGAGSAFTYGRRYSLQGLCGLAPEDDDGNTASQPRQQQQRPQEVPSRIGAEGAAKFEKFKAQLPPEEIEAIIKRVQAHYRHDPTGNPADLYSGNEARDAFSFIQERAKEFAA